MLTLVMVYVMDGLLGGPMNDGVTWKEGGVSHAYHRSRVDLNSININSSTYHSCAKECNNCANS